MFRRRFTFASPAPACGLALAIALGTATDTRAQSTLGAIREEVRAEPSPERLPESNTAPAPATPPPSKDPDRLAYPDKDEDELLGGLCLLLLAAPVYLPIAGTHDNYTHSMYFPDYPYETGSTGVLTNGGTGSKGFGGYISFDDSHNFDQVNTVRNELMVSTSSRFGVRASESYLTEQLPGRTVDHLWIGDANFILRFAQCDYAQFWTGLGARWLTDDFGNELGFNFTYGADLFPCKPWIISANLDAGNLGNAGVFHGRITSGLAWRRFELYAGYDYLRIDTVDIAGPVAGMRVWF
jgi:hypothetical protein